MMIKQLLRSSSKLFFLLIFVGCSQLLVLTSCDFKKSDDAGGTYVKPSIDYKGKMRKGYVRKKVSTDKNAIKN